MKVRIDELAALAETTLGCLAEPDRVARALIAVIGEYRFNAHRPLSVTWLGSKFGSQNAVVGG